MIKVARMAMYAGLLDQRIPWYFMMGSLHIDVEMTDIAMSLSTCGMSFEAVLSGR